MNGTFAIDSANFIDFGVSYAGLAPLTKRSDTVPAAAARDTASICSAPTAPVKPPSGSAGLTVMPTLPVALLMLATISGAKIKAVFHPIFKVKRDASGAFRAFAFDGDGQPESMICVAISRMGTPEHLAAVQSGIAQVLRDVTAAVSDW